MTMSAISHYRGGTIDVVAPAARKLKAAYLKHGFVYRLRDPKRTSMPERQICATVSRASARAL
jgi:hypothetical protein